MHIFGLFPFLSHICLLISLLVGIRFLLSNAYKDEVTNYVPISDRFCYIELKGYTNISILNVYAPTEEKGEDKKDDFNEKIEAAYNKLNIKYHDNNGKV